MANTRKGRKKTTKKNIKNGDKLKATLPKDLFRDPRSRKGLYYGSDGLKKIKLPDGTIRRVETNVHPTKT